MSLTGEERGSTPSTVPRAIKNRGAAYGVRYTFMPRFPGPIRGIAMLENDFQLFNCQRCRRQVRIRRFMSSANKVSCYTHTLGTDPSQIRHKIAGPLAGLP